MVQPAQDSSKVAVLPPNAPAVRPAQPAAPQAVPGPAASSPAPSVPAPARPAPAVAAPATPAPAPLAPASVAAPATPTPARPAPANVSPSVAAPAIPTPASPAPASVAASSPTPARPRLSDPGRRTPPRLRVFFLRHFRACGEVKQAAERTGVAVSTLYRWRDRDESFRMRWDSLADQRRQTVEDRLMNFVSEGERTAVFHKGEQVGWRYSHTARAAIAALAYFDRREKAAQAVTAREEARHPKGDLEEDDDVLPPETKAWVERSERAVEERLRERALASRSDAAPEPKEAVKSDTSPAPAPRKIGNGQALPAFDRDRVPDVTPAPPPLPQPRVSLKPLEYRLPTGQPYDDPATQRRITRELLLESSSGSSHSLPDNWKPYGH